jgi:hypothetical protein
MVGDATTMQSLLPVDQRVETMQAFGDLLDDHMMGRLLQPDILRSLRLEFDEYRPMLDVLNGRRSAGRDSGTMKKDRVQVEHAAGVVYDWLCHDGGAVLGFLNVLSSAGISYSVGFSGKVRRFTDAAAAIDPMRLHQSAGVRLCSRCGCVSRPDAVCSKSLYKSTMVARLCLDDRVVGLYSLMLDDSGSTQTDTFAGYRQLDADGVGGSSMESQSRGSTHVHSMIFRDSYRQGIAGSRHAETLAMGGILNEPTEKRASLRRYEQVAAQVLECEGVSPIHECSNAQL